MLSTLVKLLAESNSGDAAAEQEESQGAPDAVPGLLAALLSACPPLQPLAADTEAVPRLCSRLDSSFSDAPLVRCDPLRRTIAAPIAARAESHAIKEPRAIRCVCICVCVLGRVLFWLCCWCTKMNKHPA